MMVYYTRDYNWRKKGVLELYNFLYCLTTTMTVFRGVFLAKRQTLGVF